MADTMTWEQKFAAMNALIGRERLSLRMRAPGDWYVNPVGRGIGRGGFILGEYGNGSTPEEAVLDDWRRVVTELPPGSHVRIEVSGGDVRRVRWNGFMWEEIPA